MDSIKKYIGGFFGSLAERIFVFFIALFISQGPQYMNLYLNVLSGATAEAEKSVKLIETKANELGMTVPQFIKDLTASNSQAATKSGEIHEAQLKRFESLKAAFTAIKNAGAFSRPFIFLRHADWTLAKSVQFQPALPFTLEALGYVIAGIILGMILFRALAILPKKIFGIKKSPMPA
ncbi:MAG: hypothetical protein LDLANPLL_02683 [Turneriella sp.]|nr:hypothetical protein [Turneriella sp.]